MIIFFFFFFEIHQLIIKVLLVNRLMILIERCEMLSMVVWHKGFWASYWLLVFLTHVIVIETIVVRLIFIICSLNFSNNKLNTSKFDSFSSTDLILIRLPINCHVSSYKPKFIWVFVLFTGILWSKTNCFSCRLDRTRFNQYGFFSFGIEFMSLMEYWVVAYIQTC